MPGASDFPFHLEHFRSPTDIFNPEIERECPYEKIRLPERDELDSLLRTFYSRAGIDNSKTAPAAFRRLFTEIFGGQTVCGYHLASGMAFLMMEVEFPTEAFFSFRAFLRRFNAELTQSSGAVYQRADRCLEKFLVDSMADFPFEDKTVSALNKAMKEEAPPRSTTSKHLINRCGSVFWGGNGAGLTGEITTHCAFVVSHWL